MFTGTTGKVQLIGSALCGLLIVGCAGKDGSTEERSAQQPEASKAEPPAQATVSISGCVEAAPGPRQYVLRHVRFEPRETGDPARTESPKAPGSGSASARMTSDRMPADG